MPITDRVAVFSPNEKEISFMNELNELEHVICERMWSSFESVSFSNQQQADAKRSYMNCAQLFIYSYLTYRTKHHDMLNMIPDL